MERTVIHLNIADFAVAVETSIQPCLAGYPLVISPLGAPRAVVYDMSDTAYQQGIRKGMPLARAMRLNRDLKILPPRFNRYEQAMNALFKKTRDFTPLSESGSMDGHLYMDVSGTSRLFGPGVDIAFRMKKTFQKHFSLDPIWSVASNKLIAKVATRVVKPIGEYIVPPGEEAAFLAPLPVRLLPGLSAAELEKLHMFNLFKISQARNLTLAQLEVPFDRRAGQIRDLLAGQDTAPVGLDAVPEIRADHEFKNDTLDADILKTGLYQACEAASGRLAAHSTAHSTAAVMAAITLSRSDGRQQTATARISPTAIDAQALFRHCLVPFMKIACSRRIRIRHLRLTIKKMQPAATQASLFPSRSLKRQRSLAQALDDIRKKFGPDMVRPGFTLAPANSLP